MIDVDTRDQLGQLVFGAQGVESCTVDPCESGQVAVFVQPARAGRFAVADAARYLGLYIEGSIETAREYQCLLSDTRPSWMAGHIKPKRG